MTTSAKTILILLLISPLAFAEEGPRTGYFRISVTPLELLGAEGAKAVSSVFTAAEKLTWQLSVPETYDHSRPDLFRGAWYYAEALSWGKNTPARIDLIRNNRYLFMAGALDDEKRNVMRVRESYEKAGVLNTDFMLVSNTDRRMPSSDYFERVWEFLDGDATPPKEVE